MERVTLKWEIHVIFQVQKKFFQYDWTVVSQSLVLQAFIDCNIFHHLLNNFSLLILDSDFDIEDDFGVDILISGAIIWGVLFSWILLFDGHCRCLNIASFLIKIILLNFYDLYRNQNYQN